MLDSELLKANVLIVDDQEANVLLLERMLSRAGYQSVSTTMDPGAVCELHFKNQYDLILLDLQMPVVDGFEVMEGLKKLEKGGSLPVLVITAQPDHKLRALRAGARDFVSKPFELAEVLTRVRNMLEVRLYAKALERTVRELELSRALVVGKNDELTKLLEEVGAARKVPERLALDAPPDSIAKPLQARPDVTADSFAEATALVAEVTGFALMTPGAGAERLALLRDEVFALFDAAATHRGVRRIKTLGNAYLAAAGLPEATPDHAVRAAHLGLDAIKELARFNERTGTELQVRIGLSTGPVVAGVIGRRLFVYDVWGQAVNDACRMESRGVAGRVQVSESARRLLGEAFALEGRAPLAVEGGESTWLLADRSGTVAAA